MEGRALHINLFIDLQNIKNHFYSPKTKQPKCINCDATPDLKGLKGNFDVKLSGPGSKVTGLESFHGFKSGF